MDFFMCLPIWAVSGSISYYLFEMTRSIGAIQMNIEHTLDSLLVLYVEHLPKFPMVKKQRMSCKQHID